MTRAQTAQLIDLASVIKLSVVAVVKAYVRYFVLNLRSEFLGLLHYFENRSQGNNPMTWLRSL